MRLARHVGANGGNPFAASRATIAIFYAYGTPEEEPKSRTSMLEKHAIFSGSRRDQFINMSLRHGVINYLPDSMSLISVAVRYSLFE